MNAKRRLARFALAVPGLVAAQPVAAAQDTIPRVEVSLTLKESHAGHRHGLPAYRLRGERIIPDLEFRVAVRPWKPQWRDLVRFRAYLVTERNDTLRVTASPGREPVKKPHAFPKRPEWEIWPWSKLRPRLCGSEHVVRIVVSASGLDGAGWSDEFILEGKTDLCRTNS